jgi:hypothetical protein
MQNACEEERSHPGLRLARRRTLREASYRKTHEFSGVPNLCNTQEWALINQGRYICFRHRAHCCVPHRVTFNRVAAEFVLDPTELALKNDGCRHLCLECGFAVFENDLFTPPGI